MKLDRSNSDLRYLRRRPGHHWEAVVTVPLDLRPLFGQTRIARSLKTDSLAEARRRRWPVREEILISFDAARRQRRLSLPELEAQCMRHYSAVFERALGWTAAARDVATDAWLEALHGSSEDRDHSGPDADLLDPEAVGKEIQEVRRRTGCRIEGDDLRTLARGLLRAGIAAVQGADNIKNARPADPPELPWIVELTRPGAWNGSGSPAAARGRPRGAEGTPSISEALDRYLRDRQADARTALSGRFVSEVRTTFNRLIEHLGDVSIGSVTRRDAAGFIDHLIATTAKSAATANKGLTACRGLWRWAFKTGVLDESTSADPWRGLSRQAPRADRVSWLPYTDDEIEKVWQALVEHAPDWRMPEVHTTATALPFMFASSLLGGLRIEEAAGLRCQDLIKVGDVLLFEVVEHDRRRLKSAAAVRRVPIHPALVSMGLLKFRDAVTRHHGAEAMLFPGLAASGPDAKLSAAASKHFGRLRKAAGVTRPRVGYHSTRSWFATSLEHADVPITLASLLLGHSGENGARGISYGRYSSGPALQQIKDAVEKLKAPKVLLG